VASSSHRTFACLLASIATCILADDTQEIVVRKIIADILHSRPTFYTVSGLQGEVDGHGDNRISKKVIEICKRIA